MTWFASAMEPADWIALAAVGGTVVAIILGHLQGRDSRRQTERIAHGERQHSRNLARDDRMFDARRAAYEDALDLIQQRWMNVASARSPAGDGSTVPPRAFSPEELAALRSRLSLYGSAAVLSEFDEVARPLGRYAFETGRLSASEELEREFEAKEIPVPKELTEQATELREAVAEAGQEVRGSLDALARLMQEHLEGVESSSST